VRLCRTLPVGASCPVDPADINSLWATVPITPRIDLD
jgi:hypothetical protein